MPVIIQYAVKLSLSIALVYLFYQFALRRLTFYSGNRWYLLSYSLLCFFIPFINIAPVLTENNLADVQVVRAIPLLLENYAAPVSAVSAAPAAAGTTLSLWYWIGMVFIAGFVFTLAKVVLQYISFLQMRKAATLLVEDGIHIYQVNKQIIPFSFGGSIFINQQLHNEEELREIIRHEFVHVKQKHTLDIMWSEILCIVNWYNPFAWLLRRSIRQNLEFIADQKVLQEGVDKKQYQYLLLKVIGVPQFRIASQFNFSSLKKRIIMMNKFPSAKAHLVKFLFALPLFAVLLIAFRNQLSNSPKASASIGGISKSDTVPGVLSLPPLEALSLSGKDNELIAFLKRNPTVKNVRWQVGEVVVELKSGKTERYSLHEKERIAAAEKKYGKFSVFLSPPPPPPPSPEKKLTEITLIADSIMWSLNKRTFYFKGETIIENNKFSVNGEIVRIGAEDMPLVLLNGKEIDLSASYTITERNKYRVITLKKDAAVKKYGSRAKNGAIEINILKEQNVQPDANLQWFSGFLKTPGC